MNGINTRFFVKILVLTIMLASISANFYSQTYIPGNSYFGSNNYVQYFAGNLPIIISVPHGGYLAPSSIPDRNCIDCVTDLDAYTQELGMELRTALYDLTGCYPHIIINLLHRKKLDANRNVEIGANGNQIAATSWNDFQNFIEIAKLQVKNNHSKGLYIDLHGHGHAIQRIELGYLLYEDELRLDDAALNTEQYIKNSSIKNLVSTNLLGQTHAELLRGPNSFGSLLENKGYPAIPSSSNPFPLVGEPYYTGGFNIAQHTSYKSGTIDGFQMECNQNVRFDDNLRKTFATELAMVLREYLKTLYFADFENSPCNLVIGLRDQTEQGVIHIIPTMDGKSVLVEFEAKFSNLHVYNSFGQSIQVVDIQKKENITVSNLESGVYFFVFSNGNESRVSRKVVIGN